MSTTITPELRAAAMEKVAADVYGPIFFDRLAAHGVASEIPEEQQQLLKLAAATRGQAQPTNPRSAENPFLADLIKEAEARPIHLGPEQLKLAAIQAVNSDPELLAAMHLLNAEVA